MRIGEVRRVGRHQRQVSRVGKVDQRILGIVTSCRASTGQFDIQSAWKQAFQALRQRLGVNPYGDAGKVMKDLGLPVPADAYKSFSVMGKPFDPADPDGYLASFAMRRS